MSSSDITPEQLAALKAQIDAQGAKVKALKDSGKGNSDPEVKAEVAALLALRAQLPASENKKPAAAAPAAADGGDAAAPAEKVDKKAERAAARQAEEEARRKAKAAADAEAAAAYKDIFGAKIVQSLSYHSQPFIDIGKLSAADDGQVRVIRARVHTKRDKSAKLTFLVLRQTYDTIQAIVAAGVDIPTGAVGADGKPTQQVPKEACGYAAALPIESIVDVEGIVRKTDQPITSTTQQNLELHVTRIHCVSESLPELPFTLEAASRSEHNNPDNLPTVRVETRLLSRWMDMRSPASNAIFRIQSRVGQYFRNFLIDNDFTEIHSPKMIGIASEGGSSVFELKYFDRSGYLAQSPQLYKEMALQGDLERVFEVGPVFRAEKSFTHRHLTEFTGLDLEMRINEHYFEVLDMGERLFDYMFTRLATHTRELDAIKAQYPFSDFVWQMTEAKCKELGIGIIDGGCKKAAAEAAAAAATGAAAEAAASSNVNNWAGTVPLGVPSTDKYAGRVKNMDVRMLRIPFPSAVELLNTTKEEGAKLAPTDDIGTEDEKRLGKLVKERYGVDFYIIDRFPLCLRPFYTMPAPDDARFSNSYDIFMRGEEISSGAQRVHAAAMMEERAKSLGVNLTQLKDYIDATRLGSWPHGGFGVGLERVVMLYLGMPNIRYCSLYPRDPQRLTP